MATERQIAANRRNARRSTGPRTIEGRARAAQNSFKHGVLAKPALLPDEDARAFREFVDERVRQLDPVGPVEGDIAQQIAFHLWRLIRIARVEAGLFVSDRAQRDYERLWDLLMHYRRTAADRDQQKWASITGSNNVEITDEARHAEAMRHLSAVAETKSSELAFLGFAFASAAANGDPFGKLSRYETAALNRVRRLMGMLNELQARRNGSPRERVGLEAPSS